MSVDGLQFCGCGNVCPNCSPVEEAGGGRGFGALATPSQPTHLHQHIFLRGKWEGVLLALMEHPTRSHSAACFWQVTTDGGPRPIAIQC